MNCIIRLASLCLFFFFSHFVSAQCITGKRVETSTGDTVLYSCPLNENNIISFKSFTYNTQFIFVITDKNDTIRRISKTGQLDFKGLNQSEYHVYGYSIKGSILAVIGMPIQLARITDLCFARSVNFVKVFREAPMAPVLSAQSMSPLFICAPDARPDLVTINASFPSRSMNKYVVVDESKKITLVSDQNIINADPLNCKTCSVYAVSFTGKFIAKAGDSFTAPLSNDCQAISTNFITMVRDLPKGGKIVLPDTANTFFICSASLKDQSINTFLSGNSAGYQRYVITDTSNKVLAVRESPVLPASSLANGTCRIWGLTFTGTLDLNTLQRSIASVTWSNDCYALTENYLTILKQLPDGGTPRFESTNELIKISCKDDVQDLVSFTTTGARGAKATWVVSDTSGKILFVQNAGTVDVNAWQRGIYKIYHLSYTGILILKAGDALNAIASDDCYDYSDTPLTIVVDIPRAGSILFNDLTIEKFVCTNDLSGLNVKTVQSGLSGLSATALLTDSLGRFIESSLSGNFDFTGKPNGTYKIYSLSYSGDLVLKPNDQITLVSPSSGCFMVSDGFLKVIKGEAKAGAIHFENGKDSLLLCTTNALISARFKSIGSSQTPFVYILTSAHDTVVRVLKADTFNLTNVPSGICKFWGLAYTGSLNLKAGDPIRKSNLATGCSDLTATPLILIKDQPQGGRISLRNADTSYQICYRDGFADILSFSTSSSAKLNYQYVATNAFNEIVAFDVSRSNLEALPADIQRIYGVSYLGPILVGLGDDIIKKAFAGDCYELSSNFISLSGTTVVAGNVRSNKNVDVLNYCLKSSVVDTIRFSSNGATQGVPYYYVGIQSDTIRFISKTGIVSDLDVPAGSTQVYGIAFKGSFLGKIGDKVSTNKLSDSCFGVSTNSILIRKFSPEAGKVTSAELSSYYLCPGDGQSDFIAINPTDAAPLSYAFLVTDLNDKILAVSESALFDLDTFRLGICKIYGLSYKGKLQAVGKSINALDLVSECFDVSNDFIQVVKSPAAAGRVFTVNQDTVMAICVEDLAPDTIRFINNSPIGLKYAYLVTDAQNRLQRIIESQNQPTDFNGSDPGVCRIYGVSYGGILTVFRNDDVTKKNLSSGCFDLSDNFITLNKSNTGGLCKNIGVDEKNVAFISAYPNPASEQIKIQLKAKYLKSGKPELTLIDASGSLNKKIILEQQSIDNQQITINTSDLKSGLYFLMFKNGYIFDRIKVIVIN